MEKTWRDAIRKVLSEADSPLHYTEISEQILARGHYQTDGATPADAVRSQINASIKHDGDKSPFIRVGKGIFALNLSSDLSPKVKTSTDQTINTVELDMDDSIIHSFGMYWQRDLVVWRNDPKVYGKQQALTKAVDFGKQKGIYILYDHHTVIYVGRAIDRPIGKRLYEHTIDRLASRWNRFSWFGLLDVTQEGNLRENPLNLSLASLIATLEALLIEALEPPQNRKRGDDFSAIEYLQDVDPELKEREIQATLRAIDQKLRGGG
ncbi:MAG: HTH domain-containing protein [Proteobacteria bacterium]|nr:HTH domain-containing protein [Pseudomonadota bacterium]